MNIFGSSTCLASLSNSLAKKLFHRHFCRRSVLFLRSNSSYQFIPEKIVDNDYICKEVKLEPILTEELKEPEVVRHFPPKQDLKHCDSLLQFFEPEQFWGKGLVNESVFGQTWTVEVLREKSNADLHRLWFVILMERNVVLTLDRECEETDRTTPGEERLAILEQSMENILQVVQERDDAYQLLEHGRSRPKGAYAWNMFGFRHWKWFKEHPVPWWRNNRFSLKNIGYRDYVIPWMRLRLERRRLKQFAERKYFLNKMKKSAHLYPQVPIPPLPSGIENPWTRAKFNLTTYMNKHNARKVKVNEDALKH